MKILLFLDFHHKGILEYVAFESSNDLSAIVLFHQVNKWNTLIWKIFKVPFFSVVKRNITLQVSGSPVE